MSDIVSALRVRIARVVKLQSWRGTPTAKFEREDGFFLVDCWFDSGPKMQVRDHVDSLEEAMQVQVAIGMAIEWFAEQDVVLRGETQ